MFEKGNKILYRGGTKEGHGAIGKHQFEIWNREHKHDRKAAMLAYCYDCMGFYEDGRMDCLCGDCPLYPWMPYRGKSPR